MNDQKPRLGLPERPQMRPDTGRTPLRDRLRGKERSFTTNQNRLEVPDLIRNRNDGVSFEFKRHTVHGQEDPFYLGNMRQQGWEPVDATDVPEMVPEGMTGSVIIDGQMLMARPQELTDKARAEVAKLSSQQMADRARMLGIAPNGQAPRLAPEIKNEIMRPIAAEE